MSEKWSRNAELVNQRGLHARASAALAREASKFNARVTVRYDGMSAGDWLRRYFRREFGATMQRRWFD